MGLPLGGWATLAGVWADARAARAVRQESSLNCIFAVCICSCVFASEEDLKTTMGK